MAGLENEQELLKRAQSGDIAATQCLLLRHDDTLRQHVTGVIGEATASADDVIRRSVQRTGKDLRSFKSDGARPFLDGLLSVAGDQCARALLAVAQSGDDKAAERLFSMHEDEIKRYLKTRLVPKRKRTGDEPEDTMHIDAKWHEVRQRAEPRLSRFEYRQKGAFAAFLTTIAKNLCNDEQKNANAGGFRQLDELSHWISDGNPSPSSAAAKIERSDALRDALAVLNPEQLAAVQLSLENKTNAEIAAELNRSPGAIRMLLKRAKEALHEELGRTSRWFSKNCVLLCSRQGRLTQG